MPILKPYPICGALLAASAFAKADTADQAANITTLEQVTVTATNST